MKNKLSIIVFLVGMILSWMTCWNFLLDYSYLIVFGTSLVILLLLKSKLAKYFVLLSPIFLFSLFSFGWATNDYFKGKAEFLSYGFWVSENLELYKKYRIKETTTGCMTSGIEPLYQTPYNFAVKLWVKTLGYQKGSYNGIFFPEKDWCIKELKSIQELSQAKLDSNKIVINYNEKELVINKGEYHYWYFDNAIGENPLSSFSKKIQTKKVNDDCLIAKFNKDYIHLIDIKNNKFFHIYDLRIKE